MKQFILDFWLELRIRWARMDINQATTRKEQEEAWLAMSSLIRRRSPQQVRRMEIRKGLL